MSVPLQQFLQRYRGCRGIYAVCSAQRWVIEASMQQAICDGTPLLIEATSNQVNQEGGYTGMTPSSFRTYVFQIAEAMQFQKERLILGGDHLGPNPWRHLPAEKAMQHAATMVADYAAAGFTKLHLDASMPCLGDPSPLPDATIAHRATLLCAAAESAANQAGLPAPIYIIGTEVPPPGGASHALQVVAVTACEAVEQTLATHQQLFADATLQSAWERVIAIVVQPGVEFDHDSVIEYEAPKASHLQSFLKAHPELVFEAHSTDYQQAPAYAELIRDGFAILKVGPALTFAMREAFFALEAIERDLVSPSAQSNLSDVIEKVMLAEPGYWKNYYSGSEIEQHTLRRYSYSDRIRYYWNHPRIEESLKQLLSNLHTHSIPETMLSQHLPQQYEALRAGLITADPRQLIHHKIRTAIQPYSTACLGSGPSD